MKQVIKLQPAALGLWFVMMVALGPAAQAQSCRADNDCDDGRYCNGAEVCRSGRCSGGTPPNCRAAAECRPGMNCRCVEDERTCRFEGTDADGDGHAPIAQGGDDCDDANPRRYPGATEVCDPAGVDEDCNASTPGNQDADRDGYIDAACFNR